MLNFVIWFFVIMGLFKAGLISVILFTSISLEVAKQDRESKALQECVRISKKEMERLRKNIISVEEVKEKMDNGI